VTVNLDAPVCVSVSAVGNALKVFAPGLDDAVGVADSVADGDGAGGSGAGVVDGGGAHAASAQQASAKNSFVMRRA
jgi:hypothetical protein